MPQRNVVHERFIFWNASQKPGESADEYVLRLRKLADSCEFETQKDSMIRDHIVCGTNDKSAQDRLLRERPLPGLNRAVEIVRVAEISRQHIEVIAGKNNQVEEVTKSSNQNRCNKGQHSRRLNPSQGQSHLNQQSNLQKAGIYKPTA